MMTYLLLVYEFFKTGLFSVGGGLATIPFLSEIAEKYGWFTLEQLANMLAVSESTPGPIGVNTATYAGFNAGGVFGGLIATLALVAPSIIVITIVSRFLNRFRDAKPVKGAFYALRPVSAGLILGAVFPVISAFLRAEKGGLNFTALLLFAGFTAAVFFTDKLKKKISPLIFILAGAAVGIILKGI